MEPKLIYLFLCCRFRFRPPWLLLEGQKVFLGQLEALLDNFKVFGKNLEVAFLLLQKLKNFIR